MIAFCKGTGLKYGLGCDMVNTCNNYGLHPFYDPMDDYR